MQSTALLAEAADTVSHRLRHAIAQNISRLEAVCRNRTTFSRG
jgi:hypothetical protein